MAGRLELKKLSDLNDERFSDLIPCKNFNEDDLVIYLEDGNEIKDAYIVRKNNSNIKIYWRFVKHIKNNKTEIELENGKNIEVYGKDANEIQEGNLIIYVAYNDFKQQNKKRLLKFYECKHKGILLHSFLNENRRNKNNKNGKKGQDILVMIPYAYYFKDFCNLKSGDNENNDKVLLEKYFGCKVEKIVSLFKENNLKKTKIRQYFDEYSRIVNKIINDLNDSENKDLILSEVELRSENKDFILSEVELRSENKNFILSKVELHRLKGQIMYDSGRNVSGVDESKYYFIALIDKTLDVINNGCGIDSKLFLRYLRKHFETLYAYAYYYLDDDNKK